MGANSLIDGSDPNLQALRKEIELKEKVKHRKAEEQSGSKRMQRLANQSEWRRHLKRAQRYLNLDTMQTPKSELATTVLPDIQSISITGANDHGLVLFACVDVEAFEFDQSRITEIGVSTLATKDLMAIQPGVRGSNWFGKIQSYHYRIREHGHLVNRQHVKGCPEKFDFGESRWISINDVSTIFEECCRPDWLLHSEEVCQVVLVGHDVSSDIRYFSKIGLDIVNWFSDCVDTSNLFRASNRDDRQISLGALLLQYGIGARHLHNAGNDARFTLCIMVTIAVDDFQNKKSPEDWEIEKFKRMEAAYEVARAKVNAEFEGWSSSEDEDATKASSLSSIVDQNRGEAANVDSRGSSIPNTESTQKQAPLGRQARPRNRPHIGRGLRFSAAQVDPRPQNPPARNSGPSETGSVGEKASGNRDSTGRGRRGGRNRGQGRGQGRGRPLGRGQS